MPSEVIPGTRENGKTKMKAMHYEPPDKQGDIYPIHWPPYDNTDVEKRIHNVLGPLSLFAPYSHEDMKEEEPNLDLERPITPIDEEIKSHPTSFDKLATYIRRRLSPRSDVPHLSYEDQQILGGILMGEVTGVWPEIRKQIDDPFLSAADNRELNRRIAVHIVTVCEQLFLHYIHKAEVLNGRGIFSGPANMSRLKAQLSLDANKFLNILTIRRYLVADIRGKDSLEVQDSDIYIYTPQKTPTAPKLSYKGLIETSRPKSKIKRLYFQSPEQEVKKIIATMPTLDMMQLSDLIADMPERQMETPSQASEQPPSRASEGVTLTSGISKETISKQKVLLKRSISLPEIQVGETLMEELGVSADIRTDKLERHEVELLKKENIKITQGVIQKDSKTPKRDSREYITNDLHRLMGKFDEEVKPDEDMPPLLQAITRHARHDGLKARLDKEMKELEKKQLKEHEQRSIPLRKPTHPQPAIVKTTLPNEMVVRTSDIRVSERVCMSSITLDRHTTVYNHILDDIDQHMVKKLDRNLFLGAEIREVYREIMRTIPSQHMELDDDVDVVPAAENVNMTGTMASASLVRKRSDRVINPAFTKVYRKPPWREIDRKQWVKTPDNPPKNFQDENVFAPLSPLDEIIAEIKALFELIPHVTPNMDKIHEILRSPAKMSQLLTVDSVPSYVKDKLARTYASWLQWWKSTITSDDYMKYLSTQETDYMATVFHFYDSDEEDDEDEDGGHVHTGLPATLVAGMVSYKPSASRTTHHSSKMSQLVDKERKMEDLKTQKLEFKEGFWNVNSVMLGGLGKDPVVEEDDSNMLKVPKSADTQRSAKTLKERVAARHSASMDKNVQDIAISRASRVTTLTTMSKMGTEKSSEIEGEPQLTPQERLEKVWSQLEMPDGLKLDMAIKYSCNEFYLQLNKAIDRWEKVTELILKREELLVRLEKFERMASDPNRFFEKGQKSSVKRLKEAQQRSYFYKKIDHVDTEIKQELQFITTHFQDVITYKGRPYHDKMKWDRIEMLHWLQEERKQNALQYESIAKNGAVRSMHLDPIAITLPVQKVS